MGMAGAPLPYYIGYIEPAGDLRPALCGQLHRHADDRRHHHLGRPADRRHPARLAAADRHRDHLLGRQSVDRRRAAGRPSSSSRRTASSAWSQDWRRARRASHEPSRCSRSRASASASAASSRSTASTSTCSQGERLGLIGPNGSGKSTLVNCVCGTLHNETGTVRFAGQALDGLPAHRRTHLGLARSFQLPRPVHEPVASWTTCASRCSTPCAARSLLISSPQELDDRCIELLRHGRPRRQGATHAARPDAGRDAQARAGARHGRRAQAADRRRGHGRAVAFRDRGHHRPAAAPQRSRASPSS